jgi:SAM-dependent methyltransferase
VGAVEPIDCPLCGAGGADTVWREGDYDLVRCGTCDLLYVGNPPGEEELARLYSFDSGFHTQLADGSDEDSSATDANAQHHLDAIARVQDPGRLLDVGCATGRFLAAAAARGWEAEGVELNDDTAAIAREAGLEVTTGTLESLSPDQPFDAITMWDVVEHVPDPLGLLRAAHGLLAPGGRLWLATPNVDGLFPRASLLVAPRVGRWPHRAPVPPLAVLRADPAPRPGARRVPRRRGDPRADPPRLHLRVPGGAAQGAQAPGLHRGVRPPGHRRAPAAPRRHHGRVRPALNPRTPGPRTGHGATPSRHPGTSHLTFGDPFDTDRGLACRSTLRA